MKKVYFSEENIPSLKKYVDEGKDIPPYEADKFYIGDEGGSPTYYHVDTKKKMVNENSIDDYNIYTIEYTPNDEKPENWDDEEDGEWIKEDEAEYEVECYDAEGNIIREMWKTLSMEDLYDEFGDGIAEEIINHEGRRVSNNTFRIEDIPFREEVDPNDQESVFSFLKNISQNSGESGFILPNGEVVASFDHLGMAKSANVTLTQLMAMGVIRFNVGGVEISVEPTGSQYNVIRSLSFDAMSRNGDFMVDICSPGDNGYDYPTVIMSFRYDYPFNGNRPSNDIMNYYRRGIKPFNTISESRRLDENAFDEVEPSQINLSSFKKEKTINKKLWNGMELNPKVRLRLLEIGDKFWDDLEIKWVSPKDYYMMGSMCNYNWSKYSDIDLHIIVDFSKVDKRVDFVKKFFDSKKNEWNNNHSDLNMFGYPIEIYVQDVNEDNASGGIFSLYKNKWIKTPEESDIKPIGIEKYEIKDIAADIMTIIDGMQETIDNSDDLHDMDVLCDDVSKLKETLRNNRQEGLSKDGEMAVWNIVYKVLRRSGYLDKLRDIGTMAYDKVNSITESLLSYVYKTVLNEEVVADGNAQHNPYQKRWKQERKELKEYIIAYGTLMTSMENGKQYVVLFQPEISRLVGNNYGLCIQYNQEENKYLSTIYIRAMDKFTEQIFKPEFDTRGMDNIAGTGDDNLAGQITY